MAIYKDAFNDIKTFDIKSVKNPFQRMQDDREGGAAEGQN